MTTASTSTATRVRRFLLLLAIAFSFGGFSFYAAVVVPIGSEVLDPTSQGFVTQQVTHFLNGAAGVMWLLLIWELVAERKLRPRRVTKQLSVLAGVLGLCCIVLPVIHPWLDALLEADSFSISDVEEFYFRHQVYLWLCSLQWLASLAVIWVLLSNWRQPSAELDADAWNSQDTLPTPE